MAPCGIGKKFIAELLGTFFLVFFGTGSAVITLMISESVNPNNEGIGILGGLGDWIAIALAFGLTVMVCIYLFGRISGAHLNPAVTIGLLVSKNISLADSVYYIVASGNRSLFRKFSSIFMFRNAFSSCWRFRCNCSRHGCKLFTNNICGIYWNFLFSACNNGCCC